MLIGVSDLQMSKMYSFESAAKAETNEELMSYLNSVASSFVFNELSTGVHPPLTPLPKDPTMAEMTMVTPSDFHVEGRTGTNRSRPRVKINDETQIRIDDCANPEFWLQIEVPQLKRVRELEEENEQLKKKLKELEEVE